MGKVIAVVNQKGGVAKTTTSISLAAGLVRKGFRVLLVDADPQASLTVALGYTDTESLPVTITTRMRDIMEDRDTDPESGILLHEEGMHLLPSDVSLAELEFEMFASMNREYVLKELTDRIKDGYDYVIIDGLPSLGLLSINILAAADEVIIPISIEYLAFRAFGQLVRSIMRVRRKINRRLGFSGVVFTMAGSNNTRYARDLAPQITEAVRSAGIPMYETVIPRTVKVSETSILGRSVFSHAPSSKAAQRYMDLVEEFLEKEGRQ